MKRLFTFLTIAIAALTAQATDYTDKLLVLVNGEGAEQEATISVTQRGDVYDLNLKNFIMVGQPSIPVGNVELKNITPEVSGNAIFLRAKQNITVTEGDAAGISGWIGPALGQLPVDLTAVLEDGKLNALIDLDLMNIMKQVVNVRFGAKLVSGTGSHVPNGGFEDWHTSKDSYVEPNAWHSFETATGSLASSAGNHIEKWDKGLNGSCARIFSTSPLGNIIANGTMTTGRMNAGSIFAANTANHAYLDMSKTDTDGNGDPFYVTLNCKPDSLVLWVNFKQGTPNSEHPNATVSAIITDGTYYQDPEDKDYENYLAKAKNNAIAVTNGKWQRISIPFDYDHGYDVEPKAILVTISTNADAGQGSVGDEVLVDDLTLVYNSKLSSLNVPGFKANIYDYEAEGMNFNSIEAIANGKGCHVLKTLEQREDGQYVVIKVYSADLRSNSTYSVKISSNGSTSIISVPTTTDASADTYYNIDGTQTDGTQKGRVVIVRKADGSVKKVIR